MQVNQLTAIVEPILAQHGLELDDLDVTKLGKRSVLRITVDGDGPQGKGPLLDDIAVASSAISAALDESSVVGENPYTLEVSSRGVNKPLTKPQHFRRNRTRLIAVELTDGSHLVGRIDDAGDTAVNVDVDGQLHEIDYATIKKAVVQVELNRALTDEEN